MADLPTLRVAREPNARRSTPKLWSLHQFGWFGKYRTHYPDGISPTKGCAVVFQVKGSGNV